MVDDQAGGWVKKPSELVGFIAFVLKQNEQTTRQLVSAAT